jgi:hypothetical protein
MCIYRSEIREESVIPLIETLDRQREYLYTRVHRMHHDSMTASLPNMMKGMQWHDNQQSISQSVNRGKKWTPCGQHNRIILY